MMEWFQKVPKTLRRNVRYREWLNGKAANDTGLQQAIKEVCRNDILFYVNSFLFTYDPRLVEKKIPFITYPYQDDAIREIQDAMSMGEDLVIPKSRDMGASWIVLLVFDHAATFRNNCKFFMMSRNAELVDDAAEPDSLFWKIDEIHRMLPHWLRPLVGRKKMRISYVRTGSTISGGTTTKASGIGGRATAICVDEFSRFLPVHASLVKSGLKDVSNCVIYPFTRSPEMGKQHPSYELVEQAKAGAIRSFPMHWMDHPVKSIGAYRVEPKTRRVEIIDKSCKFPEDYKFQVDGRFEFHSLWFDKYRLSSKDSAVSENLEFDDDIGSNLVFDAVKIKDYAAQNVREADIEGDLIYDPDTGVPAEFVEKRGGPIRLWMPLDAWGKPPEVQYVAGSDVALGVGKTNSCFSAGRCDISEKVLEFVSCKMKPDNFATKCVAICLWLSKGRYRTLLAWERQGPGETFGNQVRLLGYYPVYTHIINKLVGPPTTGVPGYPPRSMAMLLAGYESALYNGMFINHSREALEETLEWENTPLGPKHKANRNRSNDPSGATMNHGDRTVADALCKLMMDQRGAGIAKPKEVIVPGSLAYFMQEQERQLARGKALFPDWNKKKHLTNRF